MAIPSSRSQPAFLPLTSLSSLLHPHNISARPIGLMVMHQSGLSHQGMRGRKAEVLRDRSTRFDGTLSLTLPLECYIFSSSIEPVTQEATALTGKRKELMFPRAVHRQHQEIGRPSLIFGGYPPTFYYPGINTEYRVFGPTSE